MLRQTSNIAFPAADGSVFRQQGAPLLSFLSARTSAMPPSSVKNSAPSSRSFCARSSTKRFAAAGTDLNLEIVNEHVARQFAVLQAWKNSRRPVPSLW